MHKRKGVFFGEVFPMLSNWIDYLHATMVRIVRKGIMRDIYWFWKRQNVKLHRKKKIAKCLNWTQLQVLFTKSRHDAGGVAVRTRRLLYKIWSTIRSPWSRMSWIMIHEWKLSLSLRHTNNLDLSTWERNDKFPDQVRNLPVCYINLFNTTQLALLSFRSIYLLHVLQSVCNHIK